MATLILQDNWTTICINKASRPFFWNLRKSTFEIITKHDAYDQKTVSKFSIFYFNGYFIQENVHELQGYTKVTGS